MDRTSAAWATVLALMAIALVAWRAAGTVPATDEVLSVLAETARTGKSVKQVVRERGIRPIDWGRAVDRDAADPRFAKKLAERVAFEDRAEAEAGPRLRSGSMTQRVIGPPKRPGAE